MARKRVEYLAPLREFPGYGAPAGAGLLFRQVTGHILGIAHWLDVEACTSKPRLDGQTVEATSLTSERTGPPLSLPGAERGAAQRHQGLPVSRGGILQQGRDEPHRADEHVGVGPPFGSHSADRHRPTRQYGSP
jgi:hypothetical protein